MDMDTTENARPSTSRVIYTPRTPRMRERERFDLSNKSVESEENDIEALEDLIGQTWNIHATSALFGLKVDDVNFKLYAKKLREEIASTLSSNNVTYSAKFSIMEHIVSRPSHRNHPAIKIEVLTEANDENDTEKSIYKGILLSWRVTQIEQTDIHNSIKLPLLLCRGTRSCMDAVHSIIGRMFDCLVVALPANGDDLSWLIPIIIMSTNREDEAVVSGEVAMEYTVPGLATTDVIAVKFQISDLRKILTAITATNQDDNLSLDREHVEMFYEVLHKQMLVMGNIQLGLCVLHRITLPGITIMENRMKVMNLEVMNRILLYLNEKAFDTFHAVNINM